jgi:hypothetical protein
MAGQRIRTAASGPVRDPSFADEYLQSRVRRVDAPQRILDAPALFSSGGARFAVKIL